jgi:predicted amidohydrolase YtcJ
VIRLRPALLLLLAAPLVRAADTKADRIFVNGVVWTGTGKVAEALAVRSGKLLGVGSSAEVRKLAEKHTDVVDLKGRFVVPGFNDAHLHFLSGALAARELDLSLAETPEAVEKAVSSYASTKKDAPWIEGRGWSYGAFPGGLPDKALLDRAVPDRAAYMTSYDGHTGWCNSAALLAAGITRLTKDPPAGAIVRDAKGEPTGVLTEGAQELVRRLIPKPGEEEKRRALEAAFDEAAAHGLTSAQDARFDPEDLPVFERVLRTSGFKVRLYAALPMEKDPSPELLERYLKLRAGYRGPVLKFGAVKGYVDGVVESKTAAMLEPYVGGGTGQLNFTPDELRATVARYDKEGFQIFLHAIGDRAIRLALDSYEAAAQANGTTGRRHRVEHIEVPNLADIPRFKALGVVASTQAFFANPDADTLGVYSKNLGPERAAHAMPFRLLDEAGAVQAFGSDWPVETLDVLKGIYAAVVRETDQGTPAGGWHPELRISVEKALSHYTRDAAYASFDESVKGTLSPGMLADFVVLSANILEAPPSEILRTRVLRTVKGGDDTYRAAGF